MNATNIIKNTIIIALSITTLVGIAQTVDARHDADSARHDAQNAKTAMAELRTSSDAKTDRLESAIARAQAKIDKLNPANAKQKKTIAATEQAREQLAAENASLKNRLAAKPKTITRTVTQNDPYKLASCTTDDYTQHNCVWKATDRGKDRGMTYMVDANGFAWYRDDDILGGMIGWSDQD